MNNLYFFRSQIQNSFHAYEADLAGASTENVSIAGFWVVIIGPSELLALMSTANVLRGL